MRTSLNHLPEAQHQIFSYPQARRPITPSSGLRVARGMSVILLLSDHSGHWPELILNGSAEIDPHRSGVCIAVIER
jgi:hypothetical protein